MRVYHQPVELIIETAPPVQAKGKNGDVKKNLKDAGITVTSIQKEPTTHKRGAKAFDATANEKLHVKTQIKDSEMNSWDVAHISAKALGVKSTFIEPDFLQEFVTDRNIDASYKRSKLHSKNITKSNDGFDPDWQPHRNSIWHLGDGFSQLKPAREAVSSIDFTVRIGHIDTGYSNTHPVIPDSIRQNKLQRNFVEGENSNSAADPLVDGKLRQPGHGTGTLGILAGTKIKIPTEDGIFNDFLGGAPFAEVVCCRIASSVVLVKSSVFADALNYLTGLTLSGTPVHIVSMSMGGAPAKAWADAVNRAYDAGITVVTASGNNFNGLPTQHVVYPARFKRVIAACGVTHDFAPYHTAKLGEMQGCYGPARHMSKALAAFTPNTPWANASSGKIMFSGAGTSCATPQVAAAAAIYYRKYHLELEALEPWQRVEAIRAALYKSALKKVKNGFASYADYFGNGIIQANDALAIPVGRPLTKTPEDTVPWFPILTTIFKAAPQAQSKRLLMFNTELAQLVFHYPDLSLLINNDNTPYEKVSSKKWKTFADAIIEHPGASFTLKQYLMDVHATG